MTNENIEKLDKIESLLVDRMRKAIENSLIDEVEKIVHILVQINIVKENK